MDIRAKWLRKKEPSLYRLGRQGSMRFSQRNVPLSDANYNLFVEERGITEPEH